MKHARDVLQATGHVTVEAVNGLDGVRMAGEHRPDLILMDIQLPDMSGVGVFMRCAPTRRPRHSRRSRSPRRPPRPTALALVESDPPDLVLPDIMMPDPAGYDVCRRLRARPETALLPVPCKSLDPKDERLRGIEAGADDVLAKPLNLQELRARVRSLLRIKRRQDQVRALAELLAAWNATLETRVREQVGQLDRLSRLKCILWLPLAGASVASGGDALLDPHRLEISVVFLDLRGFSAFPDGAEPEEVVALSRGCHAAMGAIGFESRWDYAAIGNVTNLAVRLCAEVAGGEVLVCRHTSASVEEVVQAESVGRLTLKGFAQPVPAWRVAAMAAGGDGGH